MDLEFLKFWTDAIKQSNAAQTLMEEFGRWMKGEVRKSDELYALFHKYYGVTPGSAEFIEYESQFKEMLANFQNTVIELSSIFGVVSKAKYDQLYQEHEELKKKVDALEESIRDLKTKLTGEVASLSETPKAFDDLIKAQTEQFQKIMDTFTEISGLKPPKGKN